MSELFALDFPKAYPQLDASALFRTEPADFFVDEVLGFEPAGSGEHTLLHIEKTGLNTQDVVQSLAAFAGVKLMDVGYCGLKDRHAVTRQYFSIYLGQREVDFSSWQLDGAEILSAHKHSQKLRPGMHQANRFVIRLRDIQGDAAQLAERAQLISEQGVPNYFGEQRFGRGGNNLAQAQALLGKHARVWRERKHQFAVSALRSYLFNAVLAERIRLNNWQQQLEGETSAQAPLWGRGRLSSQGELRELEERVLAPYREFTEVLEHLGLSQERRDCVLLPADLRWSQTADVGLLEMALPPGTYATAVLAEMLALTNVQQQPAV